MGEPLDGGRWTKKRKLQFYSSRINSTRNIVKAIDIIAVASIKPDIINPALAGLLITFLNAILNRIGFLTIMYVRKITIIAKTINSVRAMLVTGAPNIVSN